MNARVSICIPSYNRPDMLAEALASCAAQDYDDLEIVIGDDSTDERSGAIAEHARTARDWSLSYRRNVPGLGQNANVNELFGRATGDRLVLLHDDDRLLPGAVRRLAAAWETHPALAVAFGRQAIIAADGTRDDAATDRLNRDFERSGPSRVVADPLVAALLQQIPNDGFMLRRDLACAVGYRSHEDIGVHCDVDFGVRLGARAGADAAYYVDALVSEYRLHPASISKSLASRRLEHPRAGKALYETIRALPVTRAQEFARRRMVHRFVEGMIKGHALAGERATALRLFGSSAYGWKRRLSPKGLYHLALIASPAFDRARRYGRST